MRLIHLDRFPPIPFIFNIHKLDKDIGMNVENINRGQIEKSGDNQIETS